MQINIVAVTIAVIPGCLATLLREHYHFTLLGSAGH